MPAIQRLSMAMTYTWESSRKHAHHSNVPVKWQLLMDTTQPVTILLRFSGISLRFQPCQDCVKKLLRKELQSGLLVCSLWWVGSPMYRAETHTMACACAILSLCLHPLCALRRRLLYRCYRRLKETLCWGGIEKSKHWALYIFVIIITPFSEIYLRIYSL